MFHQLAIRYVDELDYLVRGWVIPDHPSQASRSPASVTRTQDDKAGTCTETPTFKPMPAHDHRLQR
jgi:hypothetical protein